MVNEKCVKKQNSLNSPPTQLRNALLCDVQSTMLGNKEAEVFGNIPALKDLPNQLDFFSFYVN